MSINISDKPEMNVVNIGDEISIDQIAGISNSSYPSAANPFVTVSAGDSAYLEKDGGGTIVGTVVVDTDGTVGGNTATITGTKVEVSNYGIGTIKIDPVLGITFADNTSQSTASITTPSATISVEGKIQLATNAEAKSASNSTKAITATSLTERAMSGGAWWLQGLAFTTASSGTGASGSGSAGFVKSANAPTTAVGYGMIYLQGYGITGIGKSYNTGIDWSKRVIMSARLHKSLSVTDANSVMRLTLGKANGTPAVGDLSAQGIGIKVAGSGAINIICHNGTGGMTTSATSFTPTTAQYYDLVLISDGAGNVTCYINGSQVGTTTGGPTTQNATLSRNLITFEAENLAIITGPTTQYSMSNWYLYIAS